MGSQMKRWVVLAAFCMGFLAVSPAVADRNAEAQAVCAAWEGAFNAYDVDRLVALYTDDALFFGSKPPLYTGSKGVRDYFSNLAPGLKAKFGQQDVIVVSPDVILDSGFIDFTTADGRVVPYRFSFTMTRVAGRWRIAQHHTSPVPKS